MTSKKFFTFIRGGSVHVAPKTKILPAEAFSALLDSTELLEKVRQDAEQYRIEVTAECEKLKEQAQHAGYEAGFQEWAQHIANLEQEIINVRKELERLLIPVALTAAKKIVGREIELSEDTIVDIVMNSLKAVSQHKKITIYVNKKDLDPVEKHRTRLKEIFESLEVLSVRERNDVLPGGCIIETEGGIINAQLENQWNALERAFSTLMKNKEAVQQVAKQVVTKEGGTP